MGKQRLQKPYCIILAEAWRYSFEGEISVRELRRILNHKFRMGRQNLNAILKEMVDFYLIDYKDNKTIILKWKPDFD